MRAIFKMRSIPIIVLAAAAGIAWIAASALGQANSTGQPSTSKGDWPMYTADLRGSKYSPLADQINAPELQQP